MSRYLRIVVLLSIALALATLVSASIFGRIRGIVHDPHHRPIAGASAVLHSTSSSYSRTATTDERGVFEIGQVPVGEYTVSVEAPGFEAKVVRVTVISGEMPVLHLAMEVAGAHVEVQVEEQASDVATEGSRPQTLVSRAQIAETPGADRTTSMAFITDYVPSATMVHNQLHIRGGHQVTWAIDNIEVPNTNIASNVGPQFDPKDVDYVEVQRGAYSAEMGDRTYAVLNVIPRSGFERDRTAELVTSYGTYNATDDQFSVGDHTERFAYYASLSGNRTDHALETPTPANLHNQGAGVGVFTSLIFNKTLNDQLRFTGAARNDYFQVPNDPEQQAAGVRDRDREQDAFANFNWVHTAARGVSLTLSPFYHFNRAAYEGGAVDVPIPTDNRASQYAGVQAVAGVERGQHHFRAGMFTFVQHDNHFFRIVANDGSGDQRQDRQLATGDLEAYFAEDRYQPWEWLAFTGGVRVTRFSGLLTETVADPRVGTSVRLPRLHWVLRAAYSRYYQAPPLSTLSGPVLQFALANGFAFLPLKGERDEQHEFGLAIPWRGWNADVSYFRTAARNFFDHEVLGNSNIFFPVTIDRARIRGIEVALNSPEIRKRVKLHLSYSRQTVEGEGGVTGGLTDFTPPEVGRYFLDHDQRHTLSAGASAKLPWRAWISANFSYGSGFLNGDGPSHLPSYRTLDLSVGRPFGENWSAKVTATNLTNKRYLIDLSNTFGGSHFGDPRMVSLQVRYRFKY